MSTPSPDQQSSEEPKALTWGFRLVLLSSALYIAGCSAYFSVLGLGQLFTGSEGPVMIMAASLEVGKLVAASFLYRYWHLITGVLRFYLTLAVLVLIAITSLGNYGYLARAYEKTATTIARNETEIATLEKTIADSQRQIDDARGKTVRVNTASREDIAKIAAVVAQEPTAEVVIDVVKQEVRFAGQTVKAEVRASARDALIHGRWDPIGELLDGLPAVQTTAAKLPYLAA